MMAMMVSVGENGELVAMRHRETGGNENVMDERVRKLKRRVRYHWMLLGLVVTGVK